MFQVLLVLVALFAGTGLLITGNGLFTTLLAVRMGIADIPELYVGLVLACYAVGFILGTRFCYWFVGRVGHIRSFAALAALASCTALLHPVFESPIAWGFLRVVTGFCAAALYTIAESWINAKVPNEVRGRVLSLYMVTSFVALSSGQLLLNLSEPTTFVLFSVVAMLFSVSLVPIALTRMEAPIPDPGERLGIFALMRISPLGVALCFSSGAINASFFNLGPLFAQKSGFDTGQVSIFMAVAIFAGLVVQWPIGWLSDRLDRRKVVLWVLAGAAMASLTVAIVGNLSFAMLLSLVAIYEGMAFTLYGQGLTHANDYAESTQLVSVSAGLLFAYGVGAVVGPVTASAMMAAIGPFGLFVFTGGVTAGLAVFLVFRMTRREPLPAEDQTPFSAMPTTTPAIAELDPRAEPEEEPSEVLVEEPEVLDWGRAQASRLPWSVR
jgi:MFS family permease